GARVAVGTQCRKIFPLRTDVGNMERSMLAHPDKLRRIHTNFDGPDGYGTIVSSHGQHVSLLESQHYIINPTNPCRAFDDGVEDRLHVRGRPADNAEHLSGCRLVL